MGNSIRRIINAVTDAYDEESINLGELFIADKVERDVAWLVAELSKLEWLNRVELEEVGQ